MTRTNLRVTLTSCLNKWFVIRGLNFQGNEKKIKTIKRRVEGPLRIVLMYDLSILGNETITPA